MIHCPKCGGYHIGGPRYNKLTDTLKYQCLRCGYSEDRQPLDKRKAVTTPPWLPPQVKP